MKYSDLLQDNVLFVLVHFVVLIDDQEIDFAIAGIDFVKSETADKQVITDATVKGIVPFVTEQAIIA